MTLEPSKLNQCSKIIRLNIIQMLLQKMQSSMQREIHVCVHTVVTYSSHSDEQGHLIEVIGHTLRNDKIHTIIIYIHQQIL